MKNTYNTAHRRALRRWVRQLLVSWIKRQNCECQEEMQKVIEKLESLEESIEIIAREIARWAKPGG